MWGKGVIHTQDDHDLVNVVFQSRHLNTIIVRFEMFGFFKKLHQEDKGNFILNAIWAIWSFLTHEERL
jgi:hypothetical protein